MASSYKVLEGDATFPVSITRDNHFRDLATKEHTSMNTTEDNAIALINAAEEGDPGLVNMLLEKGADVNAKNVWGQTAFMVATLKGHLELVKILLASGAVFFHRL